MVTLSDAFHEVVHYFNSVDSLSAETKDVSVQHAREILEKLRFNKNEDSDEEKRDLEEEKKEKTEALLQAAKAFLRRLQEIVRDKPEALNDPECAPAIEKALDPLGKVLYKVRDDILQAMIRLGKENVARARQAELERDTPEKYKAKEVVFEEIAGVLVTALTYAELLEKKIAAGLEMPQWQNMPPPVQTRKKDRDAKDKAVDVVSMGAILGYQIAGVSNADLLAAAEHVNKVTPDPLLQGVGYKVAAVSKADLVQSAQKANEAPEKAVGPQGIAKDNFR